MAKKTITKKTAPATKRVVKKTTKKATTKPTTRVVRNVKAPVVAEQECACKHKCHCCCCCGHRAINFCIKVVILCIVFLLGCLSSHWMVRGHGKAMMRHMEFDNNGCVVMNSVKCPKMLELLSTADVDMNGCVSRAELKKVMGEMRHKKHPRAQVEPEPMPMPDAE